MLPPISTRPDWLFYAKAWGNVTGGLFFSGCHPSCPPLLPPALRRVSTVHCQNSHGCRHQGNQCLTPEEKVPNLLNPVTFCYWPYWHWAIQVMVHKSHLKVCKMKSTSEVWTKFKLHLLPVLFFIFLSKITRETLPSQECIHKEIKILFSA